MHKRILSLIAVLALVLAACNPGDDAATETSDTDDTATTTTVAAEAPEAVQLSYSLEAGTSLTYEVEMDQSIQMDIEGDPSALSDGGDEEIPQSMDLNMVGTSVFTHSVAEGPEPGTYEITITGDFSDMEITGTLDGEPIAEGDESVIPDDFTGMDPVEKTIIVDEQGNLIPSDDDTGGDILGDLGGMGGLDMLDDFGAAAGDPGQFIGPPFSDEEVTVGDSWSETIEIPTLPGDDPITTTVDSEVVSSEDRDGVEVFVIETTTSTTAIEFDFADILIGFMTAFLPEDASEEELAEIEQITSQLRFAFAVDPSETQMTTWFDPEAGVAVEADMAAASHVVMDIAVPDEESGEVVELFMDMTIDSNISYRIVDDAAGDDA